MADNKTKTGRPDRDGIEQPTQPLAETFAAQAMRSMIEHAVDDLPAFVALAPKAVAHDEVKLHKLRANRAVLQQQLARSEEHIRLAAAQVATDREILAHLERDRHRIAAALAKLNGVMRD